MILFLGAFSMSRSAEGQTDVVFDDDSATLCEAMRAELESVGIEARTVGSRGKVRRARRRTFSSNSATAIVWCASNPARIEVFYADDSSLGHRAFFVSAEVDGVDAAVYVSERIRSERFVADVPVPVPYAPARWWVGAGVDGMFASGAITPLVFVTIDLGYRFHRHWSLSARIAPQVSRRLLYAGSLETRVRLDRFELSLGYHPVVLPRFDLAIGAGVGAVRVGARGEAAGGNTGLVAQRDAAWTSWPNAHLALRFGLSKRVWLRVQGAAGGVAPRVEVGAQNMAFGTLEGFLGEVGLGFEVHL